MENDAPHIIAKGAQFQLAHGSLLTGVGMYAAALAKIHSAERKTSMTSIPDYLPTLASGAHQEGDGQACVMEYVSILAGERFSDHPGCTDIVLAAAARAVNDWMSDEGRGMLVPLIGRLFGTSARSTDAIDIKLAEFINSYIHETLKTESVEPTDQRMFNYLEAVLNEFDRLTGFSYETDGRQLSADEFKVLSDAVVR